MTIAVAFDVDGTLLATGGAGKKALARAAEVFPGASERLRDLRLDGMTDRAIARHVLGPGAPDLDHELLLGRYLEFLDHELAASAAAGRIAVMPGVREVIALCGGTGLCVGLCTGNLVEGARKKLSAAGLWESFAFGGYGSDAEPRAEIARAALERARALGASELVIVGDTPRDVEAAQAVGARSVGVATGCFTAEELAAAGATLAVPDLARGMERLRALLGL